MESGYEISIIIPIRNSEVFLKECLDSISDQTLLKTNFRPNFLQVILIFDDSSDNSKNIATKWLEEHDSIDHLILENSSGKPNGVGFSRNRGIQESSGKFICFLDSDDVMLPQRLEVQLNLAKSCDNKTIIGSKFRRIPENSTYRYTDWANSLTDDQLDVQLFTSFGPSVLMPTWFAHRNVFEVNGKFYGFDTTPKNYPEDLDFILRHVFDQKRPIRRTSELLLIYRYHFTSTTFTIDSETIDNLRFRYLLKYFIYPWIEKYGFWYIWGCGRNGRRFFRSLPEKVQDKLESFYDVDPSKLTRGHYTLEERKDKKKFPIKSLEELKRPFVICVKRNLSSIDIMRNIEKYCSKFTEGHDYQFV
ncbi:hypothetical protein SNEBB_002882 [Seison nebaliae]|nr:hypothetical protein SNEBB_002882 [Seison nebaliae]